MTRVILDASALLALLRNEPGSDTVAAAISRGGAISAVNYSEVLKKVIERGGEPDRVRDVVDGADIDVVPFDGIQAASAASLYPQTKDHGMSFADRACIALAMHLNGSLVTAERGMDILGLPIRVRLIRHSSP